MLHSNLEERNISNQGSFEGQNLTRTLLLELLKELDHRSIIAFHVDSWQYNVSLMLPISLYAEVPFRHP